MQLNAWLSARRRPKSPLDASHHPSVSAQFLLLLEVWRKDNFEQKAMTARLAEEAARPHAKQHEARLLSVLFRMRPGGLKLLSGVCAGLSFPALVSAREAR